MPRHIDWRTAAGIDNEHETPTPALRRKVQGGTGIWRLQQLWEVSRPDLGWIRYEWRDVPAVEQ